MEGISEREADSGRIRAEGRTIVVEQRTKQRLANGESRNNREGGVDRKWE